MSNMFKDESFKKKLSKSPLSNSPVGTAGLAQTEDKIKHSDVVVYSPDAGSKMVLDSITKDKNGIDIEFTWRDKSNNTYHTPANKSMIKDYMNTMYPKKDNGITR